MVFGGPSEEVEPMSLPPAVNSYTCRNFLDFAPFNSYNDAQLSERPVVAVWGRASIDFGGCWVLWLCAF